MKERFEFFIHVDALGCDEWRVYNDEAVALQAADEILNAYALNEGCSLGGCEDFVALNAMLAERFDDPYNLTAFASWFHHDEHGKLVESYG